MPGCASGRPYGRIAEVTASIKGRSNSVEGHQAVSCARRFEINTAMLTPNTMDTAPVMTAVRCPLATSTSSATLAAAREAAWAGSGGGACVPLSVELPPCELPDPCTPNHTQHRVAPCKPS